MCCTPAEWVLQSCEHAKEREFVVFMAQKAQDEHELRHLQIAEQIAPDQFTRILRDPEYWLSISYQERNNNLNLFLPKPIKLIQEMKNVVMSITCVSVRSEVCACVLASHGSESTVGSNSRQLSLKLLWNRV
jgi:hypothetical protein